MYIKYFKISNNANVTCTWHMRRLFDVKESSHLIHSWVTLVNDSCHINQVLEMRRLLAHHKYTRVNFSPHHTQMVQDSQTKHPQEQTLHSPYTKFYGGQFLFFSCYTCAWVTSHVCMSHVTSIKKSWYSCERVMSHMWTGLLTTHMNESCLTYELCHIYERVMSHIWVVPYIWTSHVTHMSHATHMNEPCYAYETCHIYERVMSHIWVLPHTWTSQVTHMGYVTHPSFTHSIYTLTAVIKKGHFFEKGSTNQCNLLQHTATHCNTLQHTGSYMNESCQCAPMGWLRLVGSLKL